MPTTAWFGEPPVPIFGMVMALPNSPCFPLMPCPLPIPITVKLFWNVLVAGAQITPATVTAYLVRVNTDVLNVRKAPSTSSAIATTVRRNEVYTIVEESGGWGRLKSGAGWVCLDYTVKV